MEGVAIVITQNGIQVGSTLYTDTTSRAFTTLPPGNYSAAFSYTGRDTVYVNFQIVEDLNYMILVYPDTSLPTVTSVPVGIYCVTSAGLYQWDGTDSWDLRALNTYALTSIVVLDSKLYAGSTQGNLYEWNFNNQWTEKVEGDTLSVWAMIVFNSKIYAIRGSATIDEYALYEWDGVDAWVQKAPADDDYITGLAVFNNELYAVKNDGSLIKWNGTDDWITIISLSLSGVRAPNLVEYNSKLYSAIWDGQLHEYIPSTSTHNAYDFPGGSQLNLAVVFNNALYVAPISSSASLYVWGGSTTFTSKLTGSGHITGFAEYGGKLYAVTDGGYLYEWDGGSATEWSLKAMNIASISAVLAVED